MSQESKSFEASLEILQSAARKVGSKQLTLAELMAAYKEGVSAARDCLTLLDSSEKELKIISQDLDIVLHGEEYNDNETENE